jgi:hypothetical protein
MPSTTNPDELFIRLYLDRHVTIRLANDLRGRGYDVATTQEAGHDTSSDEQQLAFASGIASAAAAKKWPRLFQCFLPSPSTKRR